MAQQMGLAADPSQWCRSSQQRTRLHPAGPRRDRRRRCRLCVRLQPLVLASAQSQHTKQYTQHNTPPPIDRDLLKLTQQELTALPAALRAEVLLGAALALAGGYGMAGPLKLIVVTSGL